MLSPTYILFPSLVLLWIWNRRKKVNTKGLPLPPGPARLPIVGNGLQLPTGKHWMVYDSWIKRYGDIVYFELLDQRFVVLGSSKRTKELLGERSSIYSGRQLPPFVASVLDYGFVFFALNYGESWRRHRRTFHEYFQLNAVERYRPAEIREAHALLRNLLNTPDNFLRHLRLFFTAVIMDVVYGIPIKNLDDPYLLKSEEAAIAFTQGAIFGTFWIDHVPFMIPFLKNLPSWIPGAASINLWDKWRATGSFLHHSPFESVKDDLAKGVDRSCVAAHLLNSLPHGDQKERAEAEAVARSVSATAYFTGSNTALSAAMNFFLAMILYPEAQKKAQAEIDRVVGPNRLPDFNDQESLPYVAAITKEVLRWRLVIPNVGHLATEDDEYDGYFIPKGTIVIGNNWSILHDPEVYPDPEKFRPERFVNDGQNIPAPDPETAFGYGRRICPGRHLAKNELFIIIASVLASFNILPPVDGSGNPINAEVDQMNVFISYPNPFKCIIKPRSPKAEALIRATEEAEI
ncbi:hypothetical protein APHAL10511_000498 [Amanita phalloides]|nr:hypothetical protein APHAL10511_000498 [Amanita phalloides]